MIKIIFVFVHENRFSNCLDFVHNMTYDCQGNNECQNNGTCFQDTSSCPKTFSMSM
jgi:hypothetical protein